MSNARIRGSTASTTDPRAGRSYRGGPAEANARRTVFFEHLITRTGSGWLGAFIHSP